MARLFFGSRSTWRFALVTGVSVALALAIIVLLLPAHAASGSGTSAAAAPAIPRSPSGCIHSEAVEALLARLAESAPLQKEPNPEDLKRPMTDREVDLLIRALEPVEIEKGKGQGRTIRAVAEGTELSPTRMRVLMDDIMSVLAGIHAREALADLKRARDLPRAERTLGQEQLRAIGRCPGIRFEDRGGVRTLRESERIVVKYRERLESLILPHTAPGPLPR